MSKFFLFAFLWYLLGSPILAFFALIAIFYFLDRQILRITPSLIKPFHRARRLSRLRQELTINPHHTSAKLEAARILVEKKKYEESLHWLLEIEPMMPDSAEVLVDIGFCKLKLGRLEEGERYILRALDINPRVRYGEPYLRVGEVIAEHEPERALIYLEQFREVHSSSCEAYYRLGQIYEKLGRSSDALSAFRECRVIYRGLPRYKRRTERRWALLSRLKG